MMDNFKADGDTDRAQQESLLELPCAQGVRFSAGDSVLAKTSTAPENGRAEMVLGPPAQRRCR